MIVFNLINLSYSKKECFDLITTPVIEFILAKKDYKHFKKNSKVKIRIQNNIQ